MRGCSPWQPWALLESIWPAAHGDFRVVSRKFRGLIWVFHGICWLGGLICFYCSTRALFVVVCDFQTAVDVGAGFCEVFFINSISKNRRVVCSAIDEFQPQKSFSFLATRALSFHLHCQNIISAIKTPKLRVMNANLIQFRVFCLWIIIRHEINKISFIFPFDYNFPSLFLICMRLSPSIRSAWRED